MASQAKTSLMKSSQIMKIGSQSNGNNNHNNSNRPIPKLDRQSLLMNTYRDSISGLDIELHPTGEQIKKEKKRLTDEVKKILDQNLKNNKVFWAEASRI